MSDRNPEDLMPNMMSAYMKWADMMKNAGIDFILTCTRRSQAEQDALYAQGRTMPGHIVTWTLHSKHIEGLAFDFVIIVHGKPDWMMSHPDLWHKAVQFGEQLGLSQAVGRDGRVLEFAHLQLG